MVGLIDHTKPPGAPHSREYYPNSITSVLWEMTRIRFSSQTKRHLGHYVYALVDPRDDAIFYVGKASGNNRAYDHLKSETSETSKNRRIKEIREAGAEPLVDILRYGLDTKEACFEVEAAIIDTLGLENLTNSVRGHGIERGRQTAAEVERLYGSKPIDVADISERLMLFFINRTYSPTMPEIEIYDCVRQFWSNVGARRRTPDESGTPPYSTALGIADGVVVRAYSIAEWFPAGTTMSTRGFAGGEGRWEFVGQLLPDHPLVGRRLVDGDSAVTATQQGYRYVN
ncbi:hypothetical protein A9Y76_20750 [Ralstonia insidiosa]|uniref:GIY-YIG domain-containing protein n=2 Tax=Ralstonia insidiosa TaxID=190721 RepID=A0A192A3Y4_9RALS|nr:hypothetical protein A9Y76_20750 [Ralstonia insidiosa]